MNIRCKFRVESITRSLGHTYDHETKKSGVAEMRTIKMSVSYDPTFHASTPSGGIELSLVKEEHARHFKLGAEYYADFSPVEPLADEPSKEA